MKITFKSPSTHKKKNLKKKTKKKTTKNKNEKLFTHLRISQTCARRVDKNVKFKIRREHVEDVRNLLQAHFVPLVYNDN